MPRRAITPEIFNDLVRAFRLQPGVYGAAARACGVDHRTAKKAWLQGWENKGFPPIKDLLKDEKKQVAALAAIEENAGALEQVKRRLDSEIEAEASREYAIKVKMEEVHMIGTTRGMVTSHAQSLLTMAEASELLAARLGASIREFAMDESEPLVYGSPEYNKAYKAFRGVAMASRDIATAVKTTLEAERLHMGEPTEIIGHKDLDDMTIEELMQEIEEGDSAVLEAKRRGIVALDGGKANGDS